MDLREEMMAGQGRCANNPGVLADLILHIDESSIGDDGSTRQTCQQPWSVSRSSPPHRWIFKGRRWLDKANMPTTLEHRWILSSTSINLWGVMMAGQDRHANIPRALSDLVLHIDRTLRVMMVGWGNHANNPEALMNLALHIDGSLRRDDG
jgi:hypothetical protein